MRENEFDYDKRYEENMGDSVGAYTTKTFQWMFLGLLTTFARGMFRLLYRGHLLYLCDSLCADCAAGG